MAKYKELVKNFEMLRKYAYDFYINGYNTREDFTYKSLRSYDDVKRRVESYLHNYSYYDVNSSGKSVYITIDGQNTFYNPLHNLFKTKSFTKNDITLHYILIDILKNNKDLTVKEIVKIVEDDYFSHFDNVVILDSTTVRNKLESYTKKGIFGKVKVRSEVKYYYLEKPYIDSYRDAINFYTLDNPLGVIGSFFEYENTIFTFKHKYLYQCLDSEVVYDVLKAINEECLIKFDYYSTKQDKYLENTIIPLKLFFSVTGGRSYVFGYNIHRRKFVNLRIEKIKNTQIKEKCVLYDECTKESEKVLRNMWGTTIGTKLEYVKLTIKVEENEDYIVTRLNREKRNGEVTKIDDNTYQYYTKCYDARELLPWIRTYISRISNIETDNNKLYNDFYNGVEEMVKMYEVEI